MSPTDINESTKSAEQYAAQLRTPSRTQTGSSIETLDVSVFLDLMLTELQQQDPLDPMDNQEMLNTISQIREIGASDKLSSTLDSVLLGQNVATAAGLIGTKVEGITDAGQRVIGAVQQVSINDGAPLLELAVETTARAGTVEGKVGDGAHTYSVVWEIDGENYGVQTSVNTSDFGDNFNGSIRLENLPQLDESVSRKVYRTDESGVPRYVGTLPNGKSTGFTDTLAAGELGTEEFPPRVNILRYADSVKVRLSNVSGVETL